MKQFGILILIAALLLGLCACGQKDTAPEPEPVSVPTAPVAPPDSYRENAAEAAESAPEPPADAVIGEAHVEQIELPEIPIEETPEPIEPTPAPVEPTPAPSVPEAPVEAPSMESGLTAQEPSEGGAILTDPESGQEYAADRLILSFERDLSDEELDDLLRDYDLTLQYRYRNLNLCAVSFPARDNKGLSALIAALERDERISGAERDYVIRLDDPVTVDR